ncbi:metalloprotease [Atractiella rhizophila]|nr:metalloprotease [Atractiella rhizophila]
MVSKLLPFALVAGALAAPSPFNGTTLVDRCGTLITSEELAQNQASFQQALDNKGLTLQDYASVARVKTAPGARIAAPINVYFHNVYSTNSTTGGYLSDSAIATHISTLNEQLAATGTSYTLAAITRTQNSNWFRGAGPNLNTGAENSLAVAMKTGLRQGGAADLNLYTVGFQGSLNGLLGYATFPEWYEDEPEYDGVVYRYDTGPGGSAAPYNEGKTLAHETGHWLGLYHVFEGGCTGDGDFVDDTPPQSTATSGCPASQDSCPGGGVDSIHNYMDYSDDACLTDWSAGQITRLTAAIDLYRGIS